MKQNKGEKFYSEALYNGNILKHKNQSDFGGGGVGQKISNEERKGNKNIEIKESKKDSKFEVIDKGNVNLVFNNVKNPVSDAFKGWISNFLDFISSFPTSFIK